MYKAGLWPTLNATLNATACWSKHVPGCSYNPWGSIVPKANGGVPQAASTASHGVQLAADLDNIIPDPNSSAILIIDWEAWRPLYAENDDGLSSYREYSRRLVLADPEWKHADNATATVAEAQRRFDEGAKTFFTYTVATVKRLRPSVRVGFYSQGIDQPNSAGGDKDNAALLWLWEIVDILAPSIYPSSNQTRDKAAIEATVRGAVASAALVQPPAKRPQVYPYARAFVGPGGAAFTKLELAEQVQLSAGLGVDGIILWGASEDYTQKGCIMVGSELNTFVGPTIAKCLANRAECSTVHCSGHGNCVDYDPATLERTCLDPPEATRLTCRCKDGYVGAACGPPTPSPAPPPFHPPAPPPMCNTACIPKDVILKAGKPDCCTWGKESLKCPGPAHYRCGVHALRSNQTTASAMPASATPAKQ